MMIVSCLKFAVKKKQRILINYGIMIRMRRMKYEEHHETQAQDIALK